MKERKEARRAYLRAKRKLVQPWKGLTIFFLVLTLVLTPVFGVLKTFDNTVAAFVGGTFWRLEGEDPHAQYFRSDFATVEEMAAYGDALCRRVEAEGAALLKNEEHALPLAKGAAVSCFSTSAVELVYGGTGSGNIDASSAATLRTALEGAGFAVNDTLWRFYTEGEGREYVRSSGSFTSAAAVGEAPWSAYPGEVIDSVAGYGDAAVVVLSRVGGEGADLEFRETNYLALDANEKDLMAALSAMKGEGKVKKLVVLINSANPLQVDFLKDNAYGVDAVLWIGDVGISGIHAVAEILAGEVTPSGSLVDTYCYDNYSAPAMRNFTPITYRGYAEGIIPAHASTYMLYQEGIYVGYKYYETRYEDFVLGTGNAGAYSYSDTVAFPFGFGLSYTGFAYSDLAVTYDAADDQYRVRVTITNTGDTFSGKETVQVYAQSPYTDYDRAHGVEKSAVALCGFGKTSLLPPGESEVLTIAVDGRDLASYDTYGAGTYILDAGDWYLTAAPDAHTAVNNILAAKGRTPANTGGRMDAPGDAALVYGWTRETLDTTAYAASANGTPIVNRLSDADPNLNPAADVGVTWLSRSDWEGTFPTRPVEIPLNDALIRALQDVQYHPAGYESVPMPTLGARNGKKLHDMVGKPFDDPAWEPLLDQLTFDEMVSLIGDAFHWTMPVKSVEAPGTRDENGPQGLTASLLGGKGADIVATAFPSEDVMAAAFNVELMGEIGRVMGNNCLEAGVACLYGPGSNIHRTPYGGRNFEYYSEDGFLSGELSARQVAGIQAKGVNVVMKHFALNDSEQDRVGLGVWVNEQAARELYLKAFQAPIEEGGGNGVMAAYTRFGPTWSGGHRGLMTGILREEWGCRGKNITDNVLTPYVNGVDGILAGVSIYDAMLPYVTKQLPAYRDDPVVVAAMRRASHHNLYATVNSCGMNGVGADTSVIPVQPTVLTVLIILTCASAALLLVCLVVWIVRGLKFRRTQAWQDWQTFRRNRGERP